MTHIRKDIIDDNIAASNTILFFTQKEKSTFIEAKGYEFHDMRLLGYRTQQLLQRCFDFSVLGKCRSEIRRL